MKSELVVKNQEILLAKRKRKEEFEKIENKYVELAEKLGFVGAEYAYLKSLYGAEVESSGTPSAVMLGIGDTENLIGQGENEVNQNVNKAVSDAILISDESDAEHDDEPLRECNKSPQLSVDKNQEEQCKNRTTSSNENQATGEIFTLRSVYHPPLFSASPSSSSDGYEVVVKVPDNWPNWPISKGPGEESNKP
ncbi:unnamed protein product [Arabis nemorensis]|uniref:Uncharacterized protein n=1 Tax=Arabis nemorensis TaxID=586526 RepID=A0A565CSW1_9BRAS|nr:unnamed protein product [Arabis nemorensis]